MRNILPVLMMCLLPLFVQAAEETLFLRAQATIPLLSTAGADATILRRLTPGESVQVVMRQGGMVNVTLADGTQGWLRETDLTAVAPPAARLATLEAQLDELRAQLAASQVTLRDTQTQLRRAQAAASSAQDAGASETAELAAERDRLARALEENRAALATTRSRLAELEMAQEAQRLLANTRPETESDLSSRFETREVLFAGVLALILALGGAWLGSSAVHRRLRQRYHGLEL